MATVLDISMSLDGFVAGPNDGLGNGLGDGGGPIHNWVMGGNWSYGHESFAASGVDREVLDSMLRSAGAAIVGRRMYDVVDGWGDDPPWGIPVFVLTHRGAPPQRRGTTAFTYVGDGVHSAHAQARDAAGGKDVVISGGANVAQQFLSAGLIDELQLHIAPVLIGDGVPLFAHLGQHPINLVPLAVRESEHATHIRYRIDPPSTAPVG
jgi:dihydrofolate reductase